MSEILWTKHARERNSQRQITQKWVEQTINYPDKTTALEEGKTEFKKKFNEFTVTVISTKSREGKYLILSTWMNPPAFGTENFKDRKYLKSLKKAGNLKKFWITLLHQLGI